MPDTGTPALPLRGSHAVEQDFLSAVSGFAALVNTYTTASIQWTVVSQSRLLQLLDQ